MPDKKQRFYRLLETYMNDSRKEDLELMYGKGSKIKVHNWTHNTKGDTFIFELIVVLGDTINIFYFGIKKLQGFFQQGFSHIFFLL